MQPRLLADEPSGRGTSHDLLEGLTPSLLPGPHLVRRRGRQHRADDRLLARIEGRSGVDECAHTRRDLVCIHSSDGTSALRFCP